MLASHRRIWNVRIRGAGFLTIFTAAWPLHGLPTRPAAAQTAAAPQHATHPLYGCWNATRNLSGSTLWLTRITLCFDNPTTLTYIEFEGGHGASRDLEWSFPRPGVVKTLKTECHYKVLAFGQYLVLSECSEKRRYLAGWYRRGPMSEGATRDLQQGLIPQEFKGNGRW